MFRKVADVALVYLAWVVSGALALYAALKLWELVRWAYVALRLNPWGYAAASNLTIVALGLAALVAILYLEHLYRQAYAQRKVLRRFVQVTAIEAACALVAGGVPLLF